jgi:hypothetical protein
MIFAVFSAQAFLWLAMPGRYKKSWKKNAPAR